MTGLERDHIQANYPWLLTGIIIRCYQVDRRRALIIYV